jgi:hypothetical protein
LQAKISGLLADRVIQIIHSNIIIPLSNIVVSKAVTTLSEKAQRFCNSGKTL